MASVLGTSEAAAPQAHQRCWPRTGTRQRFEESSKLANISRAWPVSLELTRACSHRWPVTAWLWSSSPGNQTGLSGGARPP